MSAASFDGLADALRVETRHDGQLWRVFLDRPKANLLDLEMSASLTALFERAQVTEELKLITLEGEGKHFSFGASVQEHLPEQCADMLRGFHRMFFGLHDSHVACHAVVRGQCLGGGLELAAMCHRVFAAPDAKLGQPEILLGVIAPVASLVLPERVGRAKAEDLCLSGRIVDAAEALRMGLVDEVHEDPWRACEQYFESHLRSRSASSLRHAVHAIRMHFGRAFEERIRDLEQLYLEELMGTHDAVEGLLAFIEKREPSWRNQ